MLLSMLIGRPAQAADSPITPEKVLALVNADRVSIGLPALTVNEQLTAAAEAKARDMADKDYFAHTSPEGKTPWNFIDAAGYSYHYAGENLAIRFTNAEEEHKAWLASPTHRANILSNRYLETGIAVWLTEQEGKKSLIVVEEFGTKPGVEIPAQTDLLLPGEVAAARVEQATARALPAVPKQVGIGEAFVERVTSEETQRMIPVFVLGIIEFIAALVLFAIWYRKYASRRRY